MTVHIIHSPTLALDIDWPDDLRLLESMGIPQIG
jgi:hypothetical protein